MSNNYIEQTDNSAQIMMGDWYIGLYITEDGELAVHIDHEHGQVVAMNEDIADDIHQWAESFYFIRTKPTKGSTFSNICNSDSVHNIVTVEVTL